MELTKTQDSRQAVRVLENIFMVKLYHSLVFIKSRTRLNGEVFYSKIGEQHEQNRID